MKCIFVCYPFGEKWWKVYELETCVNGDVIFHEDIFPFVDIRKKEGILSLEFFGQQPNVILRKIG